MREEEGSVVEDGSTDEGRTDDSDVPAFYGLVVVVDHFSPGEEGIVLMSPPPDLEIDDADLMAPQGESLHEVVAVVRTDLGPI